MTLDNDVIKKFGDSLNRNVKLSNYSWFNLGGKAEFFYKAKNISELKEFLIEAKKKEFRNYYFRCRF